MRAIYNPTGRAAEYSKYALNIGMGCVHNCSYCYAPRFIKRDKVKYHSEFTIKKDLFKKLEKDLIDMKNESIKGPILMCFINDPYQNKESSDVTRNVMKLFVKYGVNFQILTKGGDRASKDFDLYRKGDSFATTLTFDNEKESLEIEPNAATPDNRIKTIKKAHKLGIHTWVSFEPVIDDKQVYNLFDKTKDFVDLYKVGKISGFKSRVSDWSLFAKNIVTLFKKNKSNYYIKKDLESHLM